MTQRTTKKYQFAQCIDHETALEEGKQPLIQNPQVAVFLQTLNQAT